MARLAVTVGALLPYLPLLTLNRLYITDDGFTSDIYNGELPWMVLAGQLMASGQAPVWSSKLCSGIPLTVNEPLSAALFTAFPTAPALDLLVIVLVLVAAHGALGLARRLGAGWTGSVLAGIAFAGSGYLVTQLKHLSITTTVVWLPLGLLLLDRAFANTAPTATNLDPTAASPCSPVSSPSLLTRLRDVALFGLVYAEQIAAGFPQSAYIAGMVYGVWALALLVKLRGRVGRVPMAVVLGLAFGIAVLSAGVCGAPALLHFSELGRLSDRGEGMTWAFASMLPYSFSDALNFIVPYANGDVADGTYHADGFFWENYGYVGVATFFLALYGVVRAPRHPRIWLLVGIGLGAFAMVLGPRTPAYFYAWKYLPGMNYFRFPTRFLFVVDLVIALLGAVGLGALTRDSNRVLARTAPRIPSIIAPSLVVFTALDLFANQSHQNPFVPAKDWLATPMTVQAMGAAAGQARLFAPMHNFFHRVAHRVARGWTDLNPYWELRETVAPNIGVYWGVSTADCYAGIAPAWVVDVWGDHSRKGLVVPPLIRVGPGKLQTRPVFTRVMATYGVTHLITPFPIEDPKLEKVPSVDAVHLYTVPGVRARVVPVARLVHHDAEAASLVTATDFNPDRELLIQAPPDGTAPDLPPANPVGFEGHATVREASSRQLIVDVTAPNGGYLLLADTYYPGWHAEVDGVPAEIHRANLSLRAVRLPAGARSVRFSYDARPFFRGLLWAGVSLTFLLAWLLTTVHLERATQQRQ